MLSDLELAQSVHLKSVETLVEPQWRAPTTMRHYGPHVAKVSPALAASGEPDDAVYVDVTAITPTPFGEGKTTTTVGLTQGLAAIGKQAACAIRQPSMGPTFGIKGGAAGGGYSQVVPMEAINLHLTGDIHAVAAAHNLIAAAVDNQIYHESRWSTAFLRERGVEPLGIDPFVQLWRRVVDINDRALRNVVVGIGPREDGPTRQTGFDIAVASELMAILALSTDLADLRARVGRTIVARTRDGRAVTAEELGVAGAATVLLRDALWPNLLQTMEGQPAFVHTGPFANIAHGNSSIVADRIGLARGGFLVTESGFGSDVGMEKFFNIKCRVSGRMPQVVVLVATVRALKLHGGGPRLRAGGQLPSVYRSEALDLLRSGLPNLQAHIENARAFGVPVVVAVNAFADDSERELAAILETAVAAGAAGACITRHHAAGGEGARELAEAVVRAATGPQAPRLSYRDDQPIVEKLTAVATGVYGAEGVDLSPAAHKAAERFEREGFGSLPVCIAKTQYSLSHDPTLLGRPQGFRVPIRELRVSAGAGFVYALAGDIRTMPGLPVAPAYRGVDIDTDSGRVTGLF